MVAPSVKRLSGCDSRKGESVSIEASVDPASFVRELFDPRSEGT
jgi:hypothetical protein